MGCIEGKLLAWFGFVFLFFFFKVLKADTIMWSSRYLLNGICVQNMCTGCVMSKRDRLYNHIKMKSDFRQSKLDDFAWCSNWFNWSLHPAVDTELPHGNVIGRTILAWSWRVRGGFQSLDMFSSQFVDCWDCSSSFWFSS